MSISNPSSGNASTRSRHRKLIERVVTLQLKGKDGDAPIGRISKQWSGLLKEVFTDTDNFGIQFPMDLDVKMKAVLMGACFLIVRPYPCFVSHHYNLVAVSVLKCDELISFCDVTLQDFMF